PPATAAVVGDVAIDLPGRALDDRDRRVLGAFAGQVSLVLARERLRERAVRAQGLEQGNAIRTALLTAASHDLRTPLAATRAAVDGLAAGEALLDREDRAVLVETIDRSTTRLERLIDNLLDLSLLHTGAVRPDLRAVSLEEVVPLAVEGLEPAPVLDLPEDLPLVLTDPGLLERVVANLVANAVRFAPAGVPVQVVARICGAAVEIRVVDTGPGVAPEEREVIFAPFRRLADDVDRGPTGGPAGMGLGLAVARGLAEAVGAGLAVQDTPGGGLTMVVSVGLAGEVP
ncbi:sensor histidine kinase KdpD, partial [Actinotalea sp. C106]|uniref:sensor histidine kinase n=1 Tax=Actinotalea sp. C106 TaxID=2908644 RepID=UPI0020298DAD